MAPHLKRDLPILPLQSYQSHKTVRAAEIDRVISLNDRERQIFLTQADAEPIVLPDETFARSVPERGDFLVQYEDGYVSFSPRKAFLEGYAPLQPRGLAAITEPYEADEPGDGVVSRDWPSRTLNLDTGEVAMTAEARDLIEAQRLENVARMCHEVNRAYCAALGDNSQPAWADAPEWQRESAVKGVQFLIDNPDASPSASHESWLAEKERDGWKYSEVKDAEAKTHPCFVPYDELPAEQRAKDYLFQGVVRAMLPK